MNYAGTRLATFSLVIITTLEEVLLSQLEGDVGTTQHHLRSRWSCSSCLEATELSGRALKQRVSSGTYLAHSTFLKQLIYCR